MKTSSAIIIIMTIILLIGLTIFIGNVTNAWNMLQTKVQTEYLQAQAEKINADALYLQSHAQAVSADSDYELHRAAARAIDNNTRLVSWYGIRGDLLVFSVIAFIAIMTIAAAITVLILIYKNGQPEKPTEAVG